MRAGLIQGPAVTIMVAVNMVLNPLNHAADINW